MTEMIHLGTRLFSFFTLERTRSACTAELQLVFGWEKEELYVYLGMEELVFWKLAIFINTFKKSVF